MNSMYVIAVVLKKIHTLPVKHNFFLCDNICPHNKTYLIDPMFKNY